MIWVNFEFFLNFYKDKISFVVVFGLFKFGLICKIWNMWGNFLKFYYKNVVVIVVLGVICR